MSDFAWDEMSDETREELRAMLEASEQSFQERYMAEFHPEPLPDKFCYLTEESLSYIVSAPLPLDKMRRMGLTPAEYNPEGVYALLADENGKEIVLGTIDGDLKEAVEVMEISADSAQPGRRNYRIEMRVVT